MATLVLLISHPLSAQLINVERQRPDLDSNGWYSDIDASFQVVKYQTNLFNFRLGSHTSYRKNEHQFFFIQNLAVIKSTGVNYANSGFFHFRYQNPADNRIMGEALYQIQYNQLMRVALRQLIGGGVRAELLSKTSVNKAFVGAIIMNEYEVVQKREEVNFDLRWSYYVAFKLKLNSFQWNSTTYYQPMLALATDYRINTENNLLYKVNEKLQLKLDVIYFYDSKPPSGVAQDNYQILQGIRYKFTS